MISLDLEIYNNYSTGDKTNIPVPEKFQSGDSLSRGAQTEGSEKHLIHWWRKDAGL